MTHLTGLCMNITLGMSNSWLLAWVGLSANELWMAFKIWSRSFIMTGNMIRRVVPAAHETSPLSKNSDDTMTSVKTSAETRTTLRKKTLVRRETCSVSKIRRQRGFSSEKMSPSTSRCAQWTLFYFQRGELLTLGTYNWSPVMVHSNYSDSDATSD